MENLDKINDQDKIALWLDEKQKEYQSQVSNKQLIESEIYNIKREILSYQLKIKELQIKLSPLEQASGKVNSNLRALKIDIDRAKDKFWSRKTV